MVKIKRITRKNYKGKIYDITLKNDKNPYFYANGILTHNSLYPHIMIQCNLFGRKKVAYTGIKELDDQPIWTGGGKWKVEGAYFSDKLNSVGQLIKKWYGDRLVFKKEKDRREYTIKIIMNTMYGILNTPYYSKVFDKVAGGDCTRIGRQWTKYARKVFRDAGYEIIYTDSVGKDSLIRTNKGNYTIEELFKKGIKYNRLYNKDNKACILDLEKERVKINNLKVLSLDDNYKVIYDNIKSIIRHKTKKKIYKIILNNYENLIVTEDHSLIWFDDDGKLISKKPYELKNVIRLKNIPYKDNKSLVNNIIGQTNPFLSKEILILLGFWMGDGTISKANSNTINISSGLDTKEFINKILKPLSLDYTVEKNGYDIHIKNKHLRDWMVNNGFVGNSKTKKIPEFIFNLSEEQIGYFLNGFCSSDGTCDVSGGIFCGGTNKKMVLQFQELFYRIGIQTILWSDFIPNNFNGKIAKIPTYNYRLKISNYIDFKNKVGFFIDRKHNRIKNTSNQKYFAIKKIRDKFRNPCYKNYKGELVTEKLTDKYIDVPIKRIQKIEEIEYNDYVYDIETEKTHRFFANDILVHNTDSVYIVDKFKDKEKMLKVKDKIIKDIKDSVPFPQYTFDMGIDDEIKYMFFFKGGNKDKDNEEFDDDDFKNKGKGLMKKNYIYVTKDNKVKIKNLGIRKKSNSELSKKIFWEYMVPKIKEGQVKFGKKEIKDVMINYLSKDLKLASLRKDVGTIEQYRKSPTGLQAQICNKYGSGIHFLIPNLKGIGVGKGKNYCTVEEFKERKLKLEDIDLSNVWKELGYFIRAPVVKSIFDYGK